MLDSTGLTGAGAALRASYEACGHGGNHQLRYRPEMVLAEHVNVFSQEATRSSTAVLRKKAFVALSHVAIEAVTIREDTGVIHSGEVRLKVDVVPKRGGVAPQEVLVVRHEAIPAYDPLAHRIPRDFKSRVLREPCLLLCAPKDEVLSHGRGDERPKLTEEEGDVFVDEGVALGHSQRESMTVKYRCY